MRFLKRSRARAKPAHYLPVDDDEDDQESARGGYLIRAEAEAPTMILTKPIKTMRSEELSVFIEDWSQWRREDAARHTGS